MRRLSSARRRASLLPPSPQAASRPPRARAGSSASACATCRSSSRRASTPRAANLRFCSASEARHRPKVATTCGFVSLAPACAISRSWRRRVFDCSDHAPHARAIPAFLIRFAARAAISSTRRSFSSSAASASCSATCGEWWYACRCRAGGGRGGQRHRSDELDALPLELVFGALPRRDDLRAELLDHGEEDGDLLELRRLIDALRLEHHPLLLEATARRLEPAVLLQPLVARRLLVLALRLDLVGVPLGAADDAAVARRRRARDHRRRAALLARLPREEDAPLLVEERAVGALAVRADHVRRHPHLGVELGDRGDPRVRRQPRLRPVRAPRRRRHRPRARRRSACATPRAAGAAGAASARRRRRRASTRRARRATGRTSRWVAATPTPAAPSPAASCAPRLVAQTWCSAATSAPSAAATEAPAAGGTAGSGGRRGAPAPCW